MRFIKNFKQQKIDVIKDFCTSFMVPAYKDMWGIKLRCNIKSQELMWLQEKVLILQELSECPDTCHQENPDFTITQYAQLTETPVFPQILCLPQHITHKHCCQ